MNYIYYLCKRIIILYFTIPEHYWRIKKEKNTHVENIIEFNKKVKKKIKNKRITLIFLRKLIEYFVYSKANEIQ